MSTTPRSGEGFSLERRKVKTCCFSGNPGSILLGPVCEAWTGRKPISRNGCHGYLSQL
jgi:hypothetical protein